METAEAVLACLVTFAAKGSHTKQPNKADLRQTTSYG
jgi:hypothetical protein